MKTKYSIMQQTLFENENINLPLNPLFLIARVSGCFSSVNYSIDLVSRFEDLPELFNDMRDDILRASEEKDDHRAWHKFKLLEALENKIEAVQESKEYSQKSPLSEPTKQTDNERKPYTNEA
jgi:hypothetical protein